MLAPSLPAVNIANIRIADSLSDSDLSLVQRRLVDFVPQDVFDIHTHPYYPAHYFKNPYPWLAGQECLGCAEHRASLSQYMPARSIHGLYFGMPRAMSDREAINRWVTQEVRCNGSDQSRALAVVAPDDDPDKIAGMIQSERFVGIKVYHVFARREDTFNATIDDYAPEWMWKLCHNIKGVLMLHIVRERGIADESNLSVLRQWSKKYPNCHVILAHVARSFNYRHGLEGLNKIADLENIYVDTSAVTEMEGMREAIRVLSPKRVLYGSDFAVSELRGRCVTTGDSFFWLHPEVVKASYLPPTKMSMTLIGIESLLCLREACEECQLGSTDVQDIFYNNARAVLAL